MYALSQEQIDQVSGAIDWAEVGIGVSIFAAGAALTVVSGGTALVPVGLIATAGTTAEIMGAATALGLSALGGYAIGSGFVN
jgi:hypothetical protein